MRMKNLKKISREANKVKPVMAIYLMQDLKEKAILGFNKGYPLKVPLMILLSSTNMHFKLEVNKRVLLMWLPVC